MKRFIQAAALAAVTAFTLVIPTTAGASTTAEVTFSEIHYDNTGADSGEFIEVAAPAGSDVSGWQIVLYNGSGGASYDTETLSGSTNADGVLAVDIAGIQNGPDGFALARPDGSVAQFLSYEGTFPAVGGPADGMSSTDIKVSEASSTAVGDSLQVIDGVWTGPTPATRGAANEVITDPVTQCPGEPSLISDVQGADEASPCVGAQATVEAVVVGSMTDNDAVVGYYLQEEDADADADPATSEGLYVYCGGSCPELAPGTPATASGEVQEFFGMTQIAGDISARDGEAGLPTPAVITMPAGTGRTNAATYEAYEGMLATVSTPMVVSEYYQLSRYGELMLTAHERPYQHTHANAPTDAAAYDAHVAQLARNQLVLGDNSTDQNDSTSGATDEALPFPTPGGLDLGNRFRGGDTLHEVTGTMNWGFGTWSMIAQPDSFDYAPERTNPAPVQPPDVAGELQVASFNVLNYFTSIDTGEPVCGPSGGMECRGADSAAELERQRAKIVAAMSKMGADVLGLMEIQNDGGASVADLVAGLNAELGAGTYDYVDTGTLGSDAIKVALIYKPASVQPQGNYAVLDASVDPRFNDNKNRPALVQSFSDADNNVFTVAVNHLKSKGSDCNALGDPDTGDGQGNCNQTRTAAAEALVDYLETDPTNSGATNNLILGDLNSYRMEDPISAIKAAGYRDLLAKFGGDQAYSYVFDSQLGYLDHALANADLAEFVTGAAAWHINADTPVEFDYNDTVQDPSEQAFERRTTVGELYADDAMRASDHDPVLVGLSFPGAPAPEVSCTSSPTELEAAGYHVIEGTNRKDDLQGTDAADALLGHNGKDTLAGGGGDDLLCGGNGKDILVGGNGADQLFGGNGKDRLEGDSDDLVLNGGSGKDVILD